MRADVFIELYQKSEQNRDIIIKVFYINQYERQIKWVVIIDSIELASVS